MNNKTDIRTNLHEFIARYMEQVHRIVTQPRDFFREQHEQYGYLEPTVFAAINILLPKLLLALMLAPLTLFISLIFVIPSVCSGICLLLLAAVVLHALLHIAGAKERFEVTYRCVAYSSVAFYIWLVPVPFLNLLLFTFAFCTLLLFAFMEVHRMDIQKALLIVSLPGILILVFGSIMTLVSLWLIIKGIMITIHLFSV